MGPRPGSYLDASRHPLELIKASNSDLSILNNAQIENGSVSLLDVQLILLQQADIVTTAAINDWVQGESVPKRIRSNASNTIEAMDTYVRGRTKEIYGYLKDAPYEGVVCINSQLGTETAESDIHPGWEVSNFERWLRFGGRIAMLGVQYSLITNNAGRMPLRPDSELVYEGLLRTACVSELIDNMIEHALENHALPKSTKRKLDADRAMLLENEAVIDAYEDLIDEPGASRWILPASPSMDFGAKVPVHADVMFYKFSHQTNDVFYTPIDIKRKAANRKNKADFTARFDAHDLDCIFVQDREHVVQHSARSRDLLSGHIEMSPDSPYADPNYRAAVASAILLIEPIQFENPESK